MATSQLPTRTNTLASDEDYTPSEDTSESTRLLLERLQAWKHACGYIEDYISAVEKLQAGHGKEYDKVLKTVNSPLKEAHHFTTKVGGVAELFDNIRSNTQAIATSHAETAKTLNKTILPIFTRLHTEIKNKTKELDKGIGKGGKTVDKARTATEKLIEQLGTSTSSGGKLDAYTDPYVLKRRIRHSLHKQVGEENNHRGDLLQVQSSFSQFETHVVDTFQAGLQQFAHVVGGQAEQTKTMLENVAAVAARMDPLFEWNGFVSRHEDVLIDPNAPPRSADSVAFAHEDHAATKPMIAGSLERKGAGLSKLSGWNTSYTVVTPSRYLHEFKSNDDVAREPVPDMSLYLPDCAVGACTDMLFNVRGKDVSKGAMGLKGIKEHEYAFRAHSVADADQWWRVIRDIAGKTTDDPAVASPSSPSSPSSPAESRNVSGAHQPSIDTAAASGAGPASEATPASATTPGAADASASTPGGSATTPGASGVEGKTGEYA